MRWDLGGVCFSTQSVAASRSDSPPRCLRLRPRRYEALGGGSAPVRYNALASVPVSGPLGSSEAVEMRSLALPVTWNCISLSWKLTWLRRFFLPLSLVSPSNDPIANACGPYFLVWFWETPRRIGERHRFRYSCAVTAKDRQDQTKQRLTQNMCRLLRRKTGRVKERIGLYRACVALAW